MTLKILQQQFQSAILNNDTDILKNITASKNLSATESMRIYQNGYYARIIQAMTHDFPILCEQLGESAFAGLVCDYLQAYPPRDFNLRYVGQHLSQFIISRDPDFAPYSELAQSEYGNLEKINDNWPKWVVSLDDISFPVNNGIRHVHAWELVRLLNDLGK